MTFESRHDAEALGPLLAQDMGQPMAGSDLVSLVDLVQNKAVQQRLPQAAAASLVADSLRGVPHPLFLTRPRGWAQRVDENFEWEPRREARAAGLVTTLRRPSKLAAVMRVNATGWSATDWGQGGRDFGSLGVNAKQPRQRRLSADDGSPGRYGRAGALELLWLWLGDDQESPLWQGVENLHGDKLQRLAMLKTDAVNSFPELFNQMEQPPSESARVNAPLVLQPEGGKWPHVEGTQWTEAERVAMFLMRHRDKLSGEKLAIIVGQSRQRIDEVIGQARPPRSGLSAIKAKDGWTPSAELLEACGWPLQPLQSAALAVVR